MRSLRLLAFLALFSSTAIAQSIDYAVSINGNGVDVPVTGCVIVKTLGVRANPRTGVNEPFTVRLTVPPELEVGEIRGCDGDISFDPATRTVTWTGRLLSETFASSGCPVPLLVSPALAPGSTFTLTATLTTTSQDPNLANNTARFFGMVTAAADLEVTGSIAAVRLRPGDEIADTVTVTNHGPQEATGVVLTYPLAPELDFISFEQVDGAPAVVDSTPKVGGTPCTDPRCGRFLEANVALLPVGASAKFRLRVRVKPSIESASIRDRVVVQSNVFDPALGSNYADLEVFAGPRADLAVAERRGTTTAGGQIPITIEVSNDGPDAVSSVKVASVLETGWYELIPVTRIVSVTPSQGTCSRPGAVYGGISPILPPFWRADCEMGVLPAHAKATVTVIVDRGPMVGPLLHHSSVFPNENDPTPANNVSQTILGSPRSRAAKR